MTADMFVDLVADSAAAPVMDLAVIRDTAAVAARAAQAGTRVRAYGHISRRLLADGQLDRYLTEIVDDLGLQPGQLSVEIAQSLVARTSRAVGGTLGALREHGVRLVLTDAGSDWDIGDIVQFSFDEVRLSRSLVQGVLEDDGQARLLSGTVGAAHGLGLRVTAVGVETERERDLVLDAGCDYASGYLFDDPIPAREVAFP
jgi:EAL domain-containing protein (putative c-di-GMP-specific phosphodiesterase class I)